MVGKKLSPILVEIESEIWESECQNGLKPEYSKEAFRAAIKIFSSALMDKIFDLQTLENIPAEARLAMAKKCGDDIRQLVKTYTDIDTHSLYK
jgi:hypothetical protein